VDNSDPAQIDDRGVGGSPSRYSIGMLHVSYDLGFATLVNAVGYMSRYSYLTAIGCQVDTCFDVRAADRTKSVSEELRLTSNNPGPLHWITGFFYQDGTDQGPTFFQLTNPNLLTISSAKVSSTEYAGFGEVSYDLFGGFIRPLVGVRYSGISRNLSQQSNTTIETTPPVIINSAAGASGKFYHINPRFNLSVYPSDKGMFYFNAAQGFRPGALQTASQVASLQAVLGVATPVKLNTDSLWSYEVGTKWRLFDNSLNLALSLYYIDWKNAQFQTGASGVSGMINLGNVTGKGIELTVSQRTPIPGLSWQFSGGLNSTTIDNIPDNVITALPFLRNGEQVPSVPKSNAAVRVSYERPTGYRDMHFVSDVSFEYRAAERDLSTGRRSGVLDILSGDIGVRQANYEILLFADNIANCKGPSIWEEGRMIVPRPRTVGVRVSWNPQ
jgi:iron complex outermembrane receptor protein